MSPLIKKKKNMVPQQPEEAKKEILPLELPEGVTNTLTF
jgi:hypothetical protein